MPRLLAGLLLVVPALCGLVSTASAGAVSTPSPLPVQGTALPAMQVWDAAAQQVMTRQGIPGATLIVTYDGRVVLERGYGYSDVAKRSLMQPGAAFRLASVSKALTDTAISRLVQRHKLSLTEHPFTTVLNSLRGPHGTKPVDKRVDRITLKELIEHTAGWDIARIGFDPVFDPAVVERGLGIHSTPTCEQVIEYMLGRKLNHAPGTHYAYSNLGYCVLGDIIARTLHTSYGAAMQRLVFGPLGMTHTGMSLSPLTARRPDEVTYYGQGATDTGPGDPYRLPLVGALGAAGIVTTAQDLLRFVVITSGQVAGSTPWYDADASHSAQPYEDPPGASIQFEIDGSLPGTTTSFGEYDRVAYVFLGNSRNPSLEPDNSPFFHAAMDQSTWPPGDLFAPPIP